MGLSGTLLFDIVVAIAVAVVVVTSMDAHECNVATESLVCWVYAFERRISDFGFHLDTDDVLPIVLVVPWVVTFVLVVVNGR